MQTISQRVLKEIQGCRHSIKNQAGLIFSTNNQQLIFSHLSLVMSRQTGWLFHTFLGRCPDGVTQRGKKSDIFHMPNNAKQFPCWSKTLKFYLDVQIIVVLANIQHIIFLLLLIQRDGNHLKKLNTSSNNSCWRWDDRMVTAWWWCWTDHEKPACAPTFSCVAANRRKHQLLAT